MSYFSTDTYAFLTELKEHIQREWLLENKERYEEHVRTPALQFVSAAAPAMAKINQYLVADPRPSGGSLFRIHRDLRFSRDKTPYNPEIAIQIGHREARSRAAPGYFLQISPGLNKSGGGIHTASSADLNLVRDAIVAKPGVWRRSLSTASTRYWHELRPDSLQRVPRGCPADHPCAGDLKRTSFFLMVSHTRRTAGAIDAENALLRRSTWARCKNPGRDAAQTANVSTGSTT